MPLIHVSELPAHRREEAFGLVRLGSTCSEADWMRCLQPSSEDARGVLSVTATNGILLGIAAYEVEASNQPAGKVLHVPLFVAFELGGERVTAAALRGGLDRLGEKHGCGALQFGGAEQE